MSETNMKRREVLGLASAFLAGCSVSRTAAPNPAGDLIVGEVWRPAYRRPPGHELVNAFEFEEQARNLIPPETFDRIAGGSRERFNFMTFRPRMGISTADMELTMPLLGEQLFTPLVVGPISDQGLYHEDAELATLRGAGGARTQVIFSSHSSVSLDELARSGDDPLWVAVYADPDGRRNAEAAAGAGAKVLFVTTGAEYASPERAARIGSGMSIDWRRIDSIRRGLDIPIVMKGVRSVDDALAAAERGYQGIVISTHGHDSVGGVPASIDIVEPIADALAGRIPILVDGSYRRGTDVLKALILGADAVLLARPVAWGLAAYGADGVQWVLEKIQAELARAFAMIGVATPSGLTRNHLRIHSAGTA